MSAFAVVENPRTCNHKLHHFDEMLSMTMAVTLCGMNGFAEISYYNSSLRADAEKFGPLIRLHMNIENQCHWVVA